MCKYTRGREGFTILELLVVIVIIGVLAAVALPKYAGVRENANIAVSKTNLKSLYTAMERYRLDSGQYPASFSALVLEGYVKDKSCYIPSLTDCYEYGYSNTDFLIQDTKNNLYATSNGVEEDLSTYTGSITPSPQIL